MRKMVVLVMACLAVLMLAGTALAEHGPIIIKDSLQSADVGTFEHGVIDPK